VTHDNRGAHWAGAGRFRDSDSYFEGSSSDPQSANQMFRAVVFQTIKRPGTNEDFFGNDSASSRGWHIFRAGTGDMRARIGDGSGAAVIANISFTPGVGRTAVWAVSYNSPDLFSRIGALTASASGAGGVTNGVQNTTIGIRPGALNVTAESFAIVACLAANGVALDAAALQSAHDQIEDNFRQGRDLDTDLAFALDRYWDARDWRPGLDWVDRVGAQALAQNGVLERFGTQGVVL